MDRKLKRKRYPNLSSVRDEIVADKKSKEKVKSFNGFEIITNRATYQLFDGEVFILPK